MGKSRKASTAEQRRYYAPKALRYNPNLGVIHVASIERLADKSIRKKHAVRIGLKRYKQLYPDYPVGRL